jgi:hypothetical protein
MKAEKVEKVKGHPVEIAVQRLTEGPPRYAVPG